jgi:sec-independent protein translocase protein TatA
MLTSGQLTTTLALGMPGPVELLIILAIGLLIFGRRLPEVGRSLGKSIVEFKRGIRDIQNEIEDESAKPASPQVSTPARIVATEGVQAQGSRIIQEPAAEELNADSGEAPKAST